jgi:hypothetical protein
MVGCMLPLRSLFLALLFILIPAIVAKLPAAETYRTHYRGDCDHSPLDGSRRYDAYRALPEPPQPSFALSYDGVPLLAPI